MLPAGLHPLHGPPRDASRRPGLAGLALLAATALQPAEASGWCRTTTSGAQPDPLVCPRQGVPIAWPYGCAALHLDPRVPAGTVPLDELRRVTAASVESWASTSCDAARRARPGFRLDLLGDLAVPSGYVEGGPNANTVMVSPRWSADAFHAPDAAALTVVTFSSETGEILDTDVELNVRGPGNPRGMPFSPSAAEPTALDLESAVVHELGHAQGLAHSADSAAVMWSVVRRGELHRAPSADDARGLCAAYPPRDVSACDTTLHGVTFYGQGAGCGVGPRAAGARAPWTSAAVALLALLRSRRRRP